MPSPFPGMDPYIEGAGIWESFHATLVVRLADQLQPQVGPRYVVRPQERMGVVFESRPVVPDVTVTQAPPGGTPGQRGGVAVLAPSEPHRVQDQEWPFYETYLHVIEVKTRRLVTAIELLSPWNKRAGEGSRLYTRKQVEVLETDTHLVEIDLLRGGRHTVAVPEGLLEAYRPYDYVTCVSRAADRSIYECYTSTVREELPRIALPLLPPDPDVTLNLRAALDQTYESGCYALDLNYQEEPSPPLSADDAAWADALLRGAGLRH
jgi:hypothetical protein